MLQTHSEFLVMGFIMLLCQVQSEKFCEKSIEVLWQQLRHLSAQMDCCVARKLGEEIARRPSGTEVVNTYIYNLEYRK